MSLARWKRVGLGCLGVGLVAAISFVIAARPFLFPRRYEVVSIASLPAYHDAALLERAFRLPVARLYRDAGIVYQPNGSICGPTSVANVARTLGAKNAEPLDVVRGTELCQPMNVCFGGVTLDELAALGRRYTHRRVTVRRDLSRTQFRQLVRGANDPSKRLVLNFDRGPLFGTSGGHHSPVAGYLEAEDLVLVLDVNRSYRPWLVSTDRLYDAMNTKDEGTGRTRGVLVFE